METPDCRPSALVGLRSQSPELTSGQPLIAIGCSLCAVIVFLFQAVLLFRFFPGHDQSWLMMGADRLLHGAQLYGADFSEINPPLIIWLSTVPVLLAKLLRLTSTSALRLITLLLIAGCTGWCRALLRRQIGLHYLSLLLPAAIVLAASALNINFYDFAQREQLTLLCFLPWVIAAVRIDHFKLKESILIGVIAGLGVCMKPQHLITVVTVEVFLAVYCRRVSTLWRPTATALALTVTLYLAAIRLAAPLYLKQLPNLVNCYWAYTGVGFWHLAFASLKNLLYIALAGAYLRWRGKQSPFAQHILFLLIASLGAHIAFAVQHTGWAYQAFPSAALRHIAIGWFAIDLFWLYLLKSSKPIQVVAIVAIAASGAIAMVRLLQSTTQLGAPERPYIEALLKHEPTGEPVMLLSMSLVAVSDIEQHHLTIGSRFSYLWMLPAIAQNTQGAAPDGATFRRLDAATIKNLSTLQREQVAEDIERWHPRRVLVELCTMAHPCPESGPAPLDMLAWLSQSGRFEKDWTSYQKVDGNMAYEAYERTD